MTELLGRSGLVAVGTEASDVAVVIAAALGERHDVVGHGGFADEASGSAVLAERLGLEASQTLDDGSASAQTFPHHPTLRSTPQ
jgi:hypothetical protein